MPGRLLTLCVSLGLISLSLHAGTPVISANIEPKGVQRGHDHEIRLSGERLEDPLDILFYRDGVELLEIRQGKNAKEVLARIRVDASCPPGEVPIRVRTAHGLSNVQRVFVGVLPRVTEKEPNSEFSQPQPIKLNVTVKGHVEVEDVDYYQVKASKGQRLSVEVEGMRLGMGMFDPYIAIMDSNRFELAACDDSFLHLQDPVASIIVPETGAYIIQIREASYGGGHSHYRLHVGTFLRPTMVYPPGGKAGEKMDVTLLGDVSGPITMPLEVPKKGAGFGILAEQDGEVATSMNAFRASHFDHVLEHEPNNTREETADTDLLPPLAFNGIIQEAGDVDWFSFKAQKGRKLEINLFARRIRSPLDSVMKIENADGKGQGESDDDRGVDSYLSFDPPADGVYHISVRDHLKKGGADYVYRVEVASPRSGLSFHIPVFEDRTQIRNSLVVHRGNRSATMIHLTRKRFGHPVELDMRSSLQGVDWSIYALPHDKNKFAVVYTAAADAALAGELMVPTGVAVDTNRSVTSSFEQNIDLIYSDPNNTVYLRTQLDKAAVAVAEGVPFKLELIKARVPLVHGGSLPLRIRVQREAKFDAPIKVKMLYFPKDVTGPPDVTIAKGSTETSMTLNGAFSTPARLWKIAVVGSAEVNGGPAWVASDFVDLEVATPFVEGSMDLTVVERGRTTDVVCVLQQLKPFEGEAEVVLHGLPAHVKTEPRKIRAVDAEVVFPVVTHVKSPTGKHKTLFCSVDIKQNDEIIRSTIGALGTLRIDPPPKKAKPGKTVQKKPKPKAKPHKKRLSRLEQLRLERKEGME
jgi:hypothetical protein